MKWLKSLVLVGVMGAVLYGVYDFVTKGAHDHMLHQSEGPAPQWKSADATAPLVQPGTPADSPQQLVAGNDPTAPGSAAPLQPLPPPENTEPSPVGLSPLATKVTQGEAMATDPTVPPPTNPLAVADNSTTTVQASFTTSLAEARTLVQQNRLTDALKALSVRYGDRSLSPEENGQLVDRLDQLAGVVVYSRRHLLAEPHIVGQGETLEQVGKRYQVPWRLLAKINGILDPTALRPGEELKVFQGPFRAELDLIRYELTLFIGDHYAGRFPVTLGPEAKFSQDAFVVGNAAYRSPTNPHGDYWIDLGNRLGMHMTSDPQAVGGPTTAGCIGMTARDIDDVFDILSVGARVTIRR